MYKVLSPQSGDVGGPAILQISSSRSSPEVRLFMDPGASSESDSSSRHCERLDKKGESHNLCRYSSDSHLPRCVRTPTELSSCSQESDDSDALLSELESELEGVEGSDASKHAWGLQNGSQTGTRRCKRCALNYDLMERLEQTNFELQQQLRYISEKTSAREAESMRMLAEARAELLSKNEKLCRQLEAVTKEKDSMVVKYATSEKEVILARKALEDTEKKYREVVKERDQHFSRVRSLNNERARLCSSLDTKLADMAKLQKEQERLKEELSSRDIKIKWAQNKLKTEVDAHKETQAKLEQAQLRLRDLREEAEQVRRDCQEMIRRYQESEEIKSVSLDHQLKEKLSELEEQKMEKESQEEASVYHVMKQELESLKKKHKMSIDENNSLTMKIHNLEKERLEYEQTLSKLKEKLNSLKQEIVDLNGKLDEKRNVELQLEREREKVVASQQEVERLRQSAAEMQADMEACHLKEGELLEFTERLTTKSVQLQSEHSLLELKAQNLEEQNSKLTQEIAQLKKQNRDLANVSANARSPTPTLRVHQPKLQTEASVKVRPPASHGQQPKLQTNVVVPRQLFLNNDKVITDTGPQITTTTENEKLPETETRKPSSLDKVDQIQSSEPNRHRSCFLHDRHRNVETDHDRQSSARNHSPETSICTVSTTRSYVTAPSSTRGLTFIDRPRYFLPTIPQSPPDMPGDYKLDNIQKRRNVCNSTGTVMTYRIPPRRYTSGRHRGTYIKNKTDVDNLLFMCRSKKTMKETPLTAPLELSRELQLTKKRLEQQQDAQGSPRQGSAPEPLGLGSRTSSTASLETLGSGPSQVASNHPTVTFVNAGRPTVPGSPGASGASSSGSPEHAPTAPAHLELDKQMLVERIVRLQKTLARRNDKIDFLEEHIKQLLLEMKKKSK
ncbi:hypothetical protein HPB49_017767 [Dermacentor silvarum]|uniref:Uncharacterized protein n=1 Tax=Dermacentor silvarum TaxID=543639 RepID=A0ACB8E1Y2_DERSI|nr:hypothetical protein HPB49_017767 [Dermacentor silvarum]